MSRKGVEIHPINSIWAKQATKLEVQDVNKVSYWSSTVKQRISVSTSGSFRILYVTRKNIKKKIIRIIKVLNVLSY